MKTAGVVLDDWKLPIFRKAFEDAGFEYEDAGPFTVNTTTLKVPYHAHQFDRLKAVIEKANADCARIKS